MSLERATRTLEQLAAELADIATGLSSERVSLCALAACDALRDVRRATDTLPAGGDPVMDGLDAALRHLTDARAQLRRESLGVELNRDTAPELAPAPAEPPIRGAEQFKVRGGQITDWRPQAGASWRTVARVSPDQQFFGTHDGWRAVNAILPAEPFQSLAEAEAAMLDSRGPGWGFRPPSICGFCGVTMADDAEHRPGCQGNGDDPEAPR